MIRQSKSAYVELSSPEEILNGRRTHHIAIAVLKNTQLSPPETKEIIRVPYGERKAEVKETQLENARGNTERSPDPPYCSDVLKNIQLRQPETKTKTYLARRSETVEQGLVPV